MFFPQFNTYNFKLYAKIKALRLLLLVRYALACPAKLLLVETSQKFFGSFEGRRQIYINL